MGDKTLEKIIEFFEKIECPAEIVLKKNSNNNCLQEYVVIYSGEDIMFCDKKNEKFDFEEGMSLNLSAYYTFNFINKEKLLKRLEYEGYFICDIKKIKHKI